ncbi:MAG: hypothetical protein C4K48_11460 [Candidatus Thorarchaeota archaeon]|nr:MAG: hypothetical protein C4K48_11460 [Candidatus Thorarchaeota archaeon]
MSADPEHMTQYDWFSQARIHETMGDDEKALAAYEESVKIDPQYAKAWFYKARLHYRLGQMALARECARNVLKLKPEWESHVKKNLPKL